MNKNFPLIVPVFVLLLFNHSIGKATERLPSPFVILPQPHEVVMLKGSGLQNGRLMHMVLKNGVKRPVTGNILSQLTITESGGQGTLTLTLDNNIKNIPSEEGYILTISDEKAEIMAKGEAGLFYGCQSLEQLLEDSRDYNKQVPACKITDFPALSYRAVHFDVKHFVNCMFQFFHGLCYTFTFQNCFSRTVVQFIDV